MSNEFSRSVADKKKNIAFLRGGEDTSKIKIKNFSVEFQCKLSATLELYPSRASKKRINSYIIK